MLEIQGDDAADTLNGGADGDFIRGMGGADLIDGRGGDDTLNGNQGPDTVHGGDGADFVYGGQGDDLLYGDAGDDPWLNGNLGNDTISGGTGNDVIYGGQGNDLILGDDGDDTLSGDLGDDTTSGGAGNDLYVIRLGGGHDIVRDFMEGDRVRVDGAYIVRQAGAVTVVDLGHDTLTLPTPLSALNPGRIEDIAHRGSAGGGAEESLGTYDAAYAKGLRSMELDLQVTKDGHVILMHDSSIDRTTTGSGTVKELTLAQIEAVDMRGHPGEKVPTWDQFLNWTAQHPDAHIYPEVKDYRAVTDIALMYAPAADLGDRITWQSFRTSDLVQLRSLGSSSELMPLYSAAPTAANLEEDAHLGGAVVASVMAESLVANPLLPSQARLLGLDIAAWTVDSASLAQQLTALDVHRLISDIVLTGTPDAWLF